MLRVVHANLDKKLVCKLRGRHDVLPLHLTQAHHNAQSHSDEFVMEALVSFDKLGILVQDLLAYEVALLMLASQPVPHLSAEAPATMSTSLH